MFRNYLVITLRNIARHKLYSFINIAGLALGLACAIFIILFVRDELSYDKWIPGSENLYRLEETIQVPGRGPLPLAVTSFPMAAAMRDEIPGVVGMTRFWQEPMTLTVGDRQFFEGVRGVDPDFFAVIRLPLLAGDPGTVFRNPNSLVLSQKAAHKYFGDADPIGRTLTKNGWSFVKLAPGTDPRAVVAAMAPLIDRNLGADRRARPGTRHLFNSPDALFRGASEFRTMALQRHATRQLDHHLWRGRDRGVDPAGRLLQLYESGHRAGFPAGGRRAAS